MRCTSVVIADHHPVALQGLMNILGAASFKVVASCSDGTNCIQAIRSLAPHRHHRIPNLDQTRRSDLHTSSSIHPAVSAQDGPIRDRDHLVDDRRRRLTTEKMWTDSRLGHIRQHKPSEP